MVILHKIVTFAKLLATGRWDEIAYRLRVRWYGLDLQIGEELGSTNELSCKYEDTGPELERILKTLNISSSDRILDVGCGKGGAILTLLRYPFGAVDGIEISAKLITVARENLRRCGARNSIIIECDAAKFEDLESYNFLYLYNPFPREVVRSFLQNVIRSIERKPRTMTVIYYNALHEDLLAERGFHLLNRVRDVRLPAVVYVK